MDEKLSQEMREHLRALELLSDHEIDTSDIPADADWSDAMRGVWNPVEFKKCGYDIRAIANEILTRLWDRGIRPSNMSLNKLTWFVYERALTELRVLLSDARAEAWDHGPVFREIYSPSKEYGAGPIEEPLRGFSRSERKMISVRQNIDRETSDLINETLNEVGDLSAARLRDLSHQHSGPWDRVWNAKRSTTAGMVISPHIILASAAARAEKNEG